MKKKKLAKEQQQEDPKTAELQIQEYVFDGQTLKKHASKEDWLGSYRERADKTFKEEVQRVQSNPRVWLEI